jgi:hypothetical protein
VSIAGCPAAKGRDSAVLGGLNYSGFLALDCQSSAKDDVLRKLQGIDAERVSLGSWILSSLLASLAGPLLGGLFVDQLSWRFALYVNVPIGAVALVLLRLYLKSPVERRASLRRTGLS